MSKTTPRTLTGAGILKGTLISTPNGDVAIENLNVGDQVLNQFGNPVAIKRIAPVFTPNGNNDNRYIPIVIKKDKFSANVPNADLSVLQSRSLQRYGYWFHAEHIPGTIERSTNKLPEYYDIVVEKNLVNFFTANGVVMDSWDERAPGIINNKPEITWECIPNSKCIRALNEYGRPTKRSINLFVTKLEN